MPSSTISNNSSVSWRTDTVGARSVLGSGSIVAARSAPPSLAQNGVNSQNGNSTYVRRYIDVASASNSGMKFQSWREPKPLRTRPATAAAAAATAVAVEESRRPTSLYRRPKKQLDATVDHDVNNIVNRLSTPTFATKMKNIKAHPKTSMLNMNFYSWANMAAYRDYQKTLYKKDGTMKRSKSMRY